MPEQALFVVAAAGMAAAASLAGGAISLLRPPKTLYTSLSLGFASGVLLAIIAFEMVPEAIGLSSLWVVALGFVSGLALVYAFDLYVHRGHLAGDRAEQREQVERIRRRRRPRGGEVVVLGGGTSIEEVVEGLSIGVGVAIDPSVGIVLAIAIAINNLSEGMSIGEMARLESSEEKPVRQVFIWTGLIAAAVFFSAVVGWSFLRGLDPAMLGFLFAFGGGGIFYLTVTDLIPEAAHRHYQQSAALSMAAGFLVIMLLTQVL